MLMEQWNLRHLKNFPTQVTLIFDKGSKSFNIFKKKYIVLKKLLKHCTCKSKETNNNNNKTPELPYKP